MPLRRLLFVCGFCWFGSSLGFPATLRPENPWPRAISPGNFLPVRYCYCYYLLSIRLIVIVVGNRLRSPEKTWGRAIPLPEKTRDAVRRNARGKPHIESEALPRKIRATFGDFTPNFGKMWRKPGVRQNDGKIGGNPYSCREGWLTISCRRSSGIVNLARRCQLARDPKQKYHSDMLSSGPPVLRSPSVGSVGEDAGGAARSSVGSVAARRSSGLPTIL